MILSPSEFTYRTIKYPLFVGFLLSCCLSMAQSEQKGTFELTPIVGYSASYQGGSFLFETSAVSNVQLGVYGNYFLNDRWSLRSGVLYQQMGSNNIDFPLFTSDYEERTSYLTVPVTVNYHLGSQRNWYLNYGVALGFLTDASANFDDGNGFVDINAVANSTQFGLTGGIGYRFNLLPNLMLLVENSNMLGLTDTTEQRTGKNFFVSLNLGAIFKL